MEQIAKAHEKKGEFRKAIAVRKKCVARNKQMFGNKPHPETIQSLDALAAVYRKVSLNIIKVCQSIRIDSYQFTISKL